MPTKDEVSPESNLLSRRSLTLDGKPFSEYLEGLLVDVGLEVRGVASGETVFKEGDSGSAAYLIRSGSIDIFCHGPEQSERLLNRLGSGEIFGEMTLLEQARRSASAIAREQSELIVIPRDKVAELLRVVPEMALWMLKLLSHRLRLLTRKVSQTERVNEVNLKILAGQEQERKRIGRDIHDGLAQVFADYIIRLQIADQILDRDVSKARAELTELQGDIRKGMGKMRELVQNLYPKELGRVGLVGAIQEFVDRIVKSAGMEVSFVDEGLAEELPAALEATLYCIVQEALNNAKRHAQASRVSLEMKSDGNDLTLVIADNGRGFDVDKLMATQAQSDAYGLLSMTERAGLAGGRMEIDSNPGAGTTLRFVVPISARNKHSPA